ncbi:MAG TPA: TolC family protein [Acidobacteriaceae bacterium]|jgi:outer membrane protein TolC
MRLNFQPHHMRRWFCVGCAAISLFFLPSAAQMAPPQAAASARGPSNAPLVITLDEAIRRAQANEPNFAAARGEAKATALDRSISRAALLPNAVYHNQFLYTQGNGLGTTKTADGNLTPAPPIFIANNAVHEYTSQAAVTETIGLKGIADVRLADATAARAAAEYEVARRGLVATVVALYYTLSANENKVAVAQRAENEAASFTDLTTKREAGREVAHADVVKAQLQQQQRERDLADAKLAADKARLELGVLLFPDPRTSYATASLTLPPMPAHADVEAQAAAHNPELKSALAAVHMGDAEVLGARAAYLPDLVLNFNYGIDAAQFATKAPNGVNNLGYSAMATVDIPVWDWLATPHRVKQTEIRRDAARVALTATQRHLIAALDEAYAEAAEAQRQAASLQLSAQTAAESLRLTKLRYTAGEATALEVVDAQTSLTTAENAREDGVVRYETGLANLQALTGTL